MFLCEVALGDAHIVDRSDHSTCRLNAAPGQHHSVLAAAPPGGPDPNGDVTIAMGGHGGGGGGGGGGRKATLCTGKPMAWMAKHRTDSDTFYQNEYLVYDERQIRVRYVVKIRL